MRVPGSNVIADATCVGGACGQRGARVRCPSVPELDEIDTWFGGEPFGCSGDFLSASTGRLRAGDDVVDPNVGVKLPAMTKLERQCRVGVLSTLRRTLKRARVGRPRVLLCSPVVVLPTHGV